MKNKLTLITSILAAGLLVACGKAATSQPQSTTRVFPTATSHFLLQGKTAVGASDSQVSLSGAPTVASFFRQQPSPTPSPTPIATSTPLPESTATQTAPPELFTLSVYDDNLNSNWTIQPNTGVNFDLKSVSHVFHGKSAISFIPRVKNKSQYGSLLFTVSSQTQEVYLRDQVNTLSFWLYSGDEPLLLDQMAVTILGSNSQPFWKANDNSVAASGQDPVFSETRLYFLGFNRDIPAKSWVHVEVSLDKLIYDPDYKYVTGFYLKMEKGFSRTLWIDDVNLVMLERPSDIATLEITPTQP